MSPKTYTMDPKISNQRGPYTSKTRPKISPKKIMAQTSVEVIHETVEDE